MLPHSLDYQNDGEYYSLSKIYYYMVLSHSDVRISRTIICYDFCRVMLRSGNFFSIWTLHIYEVDNMICDHCQKYSTDYTIALKYYVIDMTERLFLSMYSVYIIHQNSVNGNEYCIYLNYTLHRWSIH